jgi:ANTAR domain
MRVDDLVRGQLAMRFGVLLPHLNERQRRLAVAVEARLLGHGGVRVAARVAGMSEHQRAFTTRLDIEQAKGLLAQRLGIDPPEAFQRLRRHARATNRKLTDLARDVLTGRASLPQDDPPQQPRAGTAAYADRAAESARAAARDAQQSAHAAAQAQQDARAARRRLTQRRHADQAPDGPESPA